MYATDEEFGKALHMRAERLEEEAKRLQKFLETSDPEVIQTEQKNIIEEMLRDIEKRLRTCWRLAFSSPQILER